MESADSSIPAPRPQALDFLITDLGQYLGLEGLAFDEANFITLEIDGHVLSLQFVDERVGLLLTSIIDTVAEDVSPLFTLAVCAQNHDCMAQGLGVLTLDMETADLVWTDRVATQGLTVDHFNASLMSAIEGIKFWSAFAAGTLAEIAEAGSSEDELPEAESHAAILKV